MEANISHDLREIEMKAKNASVQFIVWEGDFMPGVVLCQDRRGAFQFWDKPPDSALTE